MSEPYQRPQDLGPNMAMEPHVYIHADEVVSLVANPLLNSHLDELHPSQGNLLPATELGHFDDADLSACC